MSRDSRSRSVLVVDDDAALRAFIARHLGRRGFSVVQAEDATRALVAAQRQGGPFDLILTDVHMPGLSGVDLARLLLARSPLQPVIVITGDQDESLAREALASGASGYLLKPFELRQLDELVGQAIARLELVEDAQALVRPDESVPPDDQAIPGAWLQLADGFSGAGPGHGYRVARISGAIAAALRTTLEPEERHGLDLAAHAHELGRLLARSTDANEVAGRAADALSELGLDPVAITIVRHHFERRENGPGDDSGRPRASLVLACADAIDHYASGVIAVSDPAAAVAAGIDRVIAHADSAFDETITAALREARSAVEAIWVLSRWSGLGGDARRR